MLRGRGLFGSVLMALVLALFATVPVAHSFEHDIAIFAFDEGPPDFAIVAHNFDSENTDGFWRSGAKLDMNAATLNQRAIDEPGVSVDLPPSTEAVPVVSFMYEHASDYSSTKLANLNGRLVYLL